MVGDHMGILCAVIFSFFFFRVLTGGCLYALCEE